MPKMSQAKRLHELLKDGRPHSTVEIMERVYGGSHLGIARIGARIHDLRSKGLSIEGRKDADNPAIYWYTMTVKPKPRVEFIMRDGVRYARIIPG